MTAIVMLWVGQALPAGHTKRHYSQYVHLWRRTLARRPLPTCILEGMGRFTAEGKTGYVFWVTFCNGARGCRPGCFRHVFLDFQFSFARNIHFFLVIIMVILTHGVHRIVVITQLLLTNMIDLTFVVGCFRCERFRSLAPGIILGPAAILVRMSSPTTRLACDPSSWLSLRRVLGARFYLRAKSIVHYLCLGLCFSAFLAACLCTNLDDHVFFHVGLDNHCRVFCLGFQSCLRYLVVYWHTFCCLGDFVLWTTLEIGVVCRFLSFYGVAILRSSDVCAVIPLLYVYFIGLVAGILQTLESDADNGSYTFIITQCLHLWLGYSRNLGIVVLVSHEGDSGESGVGSLCYSLFLVYIMLGACLFQVWHVIVHLLVLCFFITLTMCFFSPIVSLSIYLISSKALISEQWPQDICFIDMFEILFSLAHGCGRQSFILLMFPLLLQNFYVCILERMCFPVLRAVSMSYSADYCLSELLLQWRDSLVCSCFLAYNSSTSLSFCLLCTFLYYILWLAYLL